MASYATALHNVTLAGPTLFGQVINTAAEIASRSLSYNSSKYFVLLIITVQDKCISFPFHLLFFLIFLVILCPSSLLQDGVVTDLQETKELW